MNLVIQLTKTIKKCSSALNDIIM